MPAIILFFGIGFLAYSIGSIPVGYVVAYIAGIYDIRRYGSGNIGATNVARVLGTFYFFPVFILDVLKAYGTITVITCFFNDPLIFYWVATTYLCGTAFSFFLGGSGGKGVAAMVGILAAYNILLLILAAIIWALLFNKIRTVGMASVAAAITVPLLATLIGLPWHGICFMLTAALFIVIRHHENIRNYFDVTLR